MISEIKTHSKLFHLVVLFTILPALSYAQDGLKWKIHDLNRPKPKIITPPAQYLPMVPPSDAVILFDGNDLSRWESTSGAETKWIVKNGYFECVKGSGYIRTKQGFGDVQLHIEWAAPLPAEGQSQGRGNSGVFLMERYEVQVLDSYENETYADGQAGAIYGQYPPLVNAARPPGEWQSYDIIFHRPHFDNLGKLQKPARLTVFHNGILIQDHVELWGGTDWLKYREYESHPDKLPISLQDHGNPLRFRNVWLRELAEEPQKAPQYETAVVLDKDLLSKYTGTYEDDRENKYIIFLDGTKLMFEIFGGRKFELITHSRDKFSVKSTAIDLDFILDENGLPSAMIYQFTGDSTTTKKVN